MSSSGVSTAFSPSFSRGLEVFLGALEVLFIAVPAYATPFCTGGSFSFESDVRA